MNFSQFTLLPDLQKMRCLWYSAVQVAEQSQNAYRLELYQLWDFYVELEINARYGNRRSIRALRGTSELDKYLVDIDISSLVEQ